MSGPDQWASRVLADIESHHPVIVRATALDVPAYLSPTGILVTDAAPETAEWFEARRGGITGTDLPKILGYSKYGNALSVWMFKRGDLEDEAGEAAEWGTRLEAVIADAWAEKNDCYVEPVGVMARVDHSHHRASLDRVVTWCPDDRAAHATPNTFPTCGLEVKTRSAFKAADWRDGIPDDTLAQVQWGLHVTGFDHMHVAALIGGQRLVTYRVDRDQAVIDYLIEAAEPVWQAVLDGVPPEAHPDADGVLLDLLNKVYRKRQGEREIDAEAAEPWMHQYLEGGDLEREGKRLKTEAKTALVQMIDDGDAGVVDDGPWFTYRPGRAADRVVTEDLARLREDHPRVYARLKKQGYITTSDPSPSFSLKRRRVEP